jgi:hypothetical protein
MLFRGERTHLSGDGSVITGERHNPDFTRQEAYRWTVDNGFETLLLPGYTGSTVYDVTPDGKWILGAGFYPTNPALPVRTLMLWSEETGPLDLRDVFQRQGLANATASWAFLGEVPVGNLPQISEDGRTITSSGINPNGDKEAWVAYLDPIVILPGDFNADGTVNAADYVAWRNGVGTTYARADYDVWRAHFGQTASSSASRAAIPEPPSFVWCVMALVALMYVLRQSR